MGDAFITTEQARERATIVLTHYLAQDDETATMWADRLQKVLAGTRHGTLKQWMTERHDRTVDTLQVTLRSGEGDQWFITDLWTPGPRRVDAARATRVLLEGSEREYAGVVTAATVDGIYLGFTAWGADAVQMVAYTVTEEA